MFGYTLIKTYELNKLKRQAEGNNNVAYAKGYATGRSAAEEQYRIAELTNMKALKNDTTFA